MKTRRTLLRYSSLDMLLLVVLSLAVPRFSNAALPIVISPVDSVVYNSSRPLDFGELNTYIGKIHLGEDIAVTEGAPVHAVADGRIVNYEYHSGYASSDDGTSIAAVIEHDFGATYTLDLTVGDVKRVVFSKFCSIYGHIRKSKTYGGSRLPWTVGDYVKKGDVIGYINDASHNGGSDDHTDVHLHMGLRVGGYPNRWAFWGYPITDSASSISNFAAFSEVAAKMTAGTLEGYLDEGSCSHLRGWVGNRSAFNFSYGIDFLDASTYITSVQASVSRPDVGAYLNDSGNHGFDLTTPLAFRDGNEHLLRARVSGTNQDLWKSPRRLVCANASSYEGYLDVVTCDRIAGWGADRNRKNTSLKLDIYVDGQWETQLTAGDYRSDVQQYLADNGLHGFTYALPSKYADGRGHRVNVRFVDTGGNLGGSPGNTTACGTSDYTGHLDWATCEGLGGWAADRSRPSTAIDVDVYIDNIYQSRVTASQSRSDVGSYLGDNGNHGFAYTIPAAYKDGRSHTVSVRTAGNGRDIPGSPLALGVCPIASTYVGYLDAATCNVVGGWAADRSRLNVALNVQIYIDNAFVTSVTANQSRPDVGSYLGDNGAHGFTYNVPQLYKNGNSHTIAVRLADNGTDLNHSPKVTPVCSAQLYNPGDGASDAGLWLNAFYRNSFNTYVVSPTDNPVTQVGGGCLQYFKDVSSGQKTSVLMQRGCAGTVYVVYGGMWNKYTQLGGPTGGLGYPINDRATSTSSKNTPIEWQVFRDGANHDTCFVQYGGNAYAVYHGILTEWGRQGWETGWLGAPTGEEFEWGGLKRQNFEGGYIWYNLTTGASGAAH